MSRMNANRIHQESWHSDDFAAHLLIFDQKVHAVVARLKACAKLRDLPKGYKLHAHVLNNGLLKQNILIGSTLISMYANCGALAKAQQVFDELPAHNVVSWTALIAAYAQHGHGEEALQCCDRMQSSGLSSNAVTFACILKACSSIGATEKGIEMHAEIIRKGLLVNDPVLGTALVDMYVKCGALTKAQQAFDELPIQNVFSWTALIAGYAQHEHAEKALECFKRMQDESLTPNSVTLLCILQACGSTGLVTKGKEIHAGTDQEGLLEKLGNALVDMYAKCGALAMAKQVFQELPNRNVVSWNVLITGYAQHEECEEAYDCYVQMRCKGVSPNAVTFTCILKACGSIGAAESGKEVHAEIVKKGLLGNDVLLANALIDLYAKCGKFAKAKQEFDELLVQDVVSWNVLISGFAQHGHDKEALTCFEQMQSEGIAPNTVTLLCVLQVCGRIGAFEKGKEIHSQILREGLLENDSVLGVALVDMYARCGEVAKAQEVFDHLSLRHVVPWTALMAGYAKCGKYSIVFILFNKMIGDNAEPNSVTFTVVLNACSHIGLINEGQMYFESISASYGIIPSVEHHTCMVDLFARAGHFDKAIAVISRMPSSHYCPAWVALLSSCEKWGNVKLGGFAFELAAQLHEKSSGAYVCMSAAGML